MNGWHPQPPSGQPHVTPHKAQGQQHGPACAPGSARRPTGTIHRT